MWMFCLDMMLILLIGLRLICAMIHVSVCGQLQLGAYDDEDVPIDDVYTQRSLCLLAIVSDVSWMYHAIIKF